MGKIIELIIMVIFLLINSGTDVYKNNIPDGIQVDGQWIQWGCTTDDICELIGEPDEITETGLDKILVYENVETEFSKTSDIEFTVGTDNITGVDGKTQSSGLYFVQFAIDGDIEKIENSLKKVYGNDTEINVNEKMQNQTLSIQEEGYFYKNCQNDHWKILNLEMNENDIDQLIEYMNKNINYPKVDNETQLFQIDLYGVQNDSIKNCTMKIYASKYVLYQIFTNGDSK